MQRLGRKCFLTKDIMFIPSLSVQFQVTPDRLVLDSIVNNRPRTQSDCRSAMKSSNATELLERVPERRSKSRNSAPKTCRAEIRAVGFPRHLFRVRDLSRGGASILIPIDSVHLSLLNPGQIIEIDFSSDDGSYPSGSFRTIVRHITDPEKDQYRGHRLVGLSILDRLEPVQNFRWPPASLTQGEAL